MDWKIWIEKRYTKSTAKAYKRDIALFLDLVPDAKTANYQQLISYLQELRQHQKPASIHRQLQSIKKYYQWLQFMELRKDNPAASIRLQDHKRKRDIQLQDLLTNQQLSSFWDYFMTKDYRYKHLKNRMLSIVSLLIFQALTSEEIRTLKASFLDFNTAQLDLPGTKTTNPRVLPLEPTQILPLHHCWEELKTTDDLVFNKLSSDSIHYLVSSAKLDFLRSKKCSSLRLRQSVIASKFKLGWDLRKVQLFAGHRYPSSTEAYRLSGLENLQLSIQKHHPLG